MKKEQTKENQFEKNERGHYKSIYTLNSFKSFYHPDRDVEKNLVMGRDHTFIESLFISIVTLITFVTFPISIFFVLKKIKTSEKAIRFRLGILQKDMIESGYTYRLPFVDEIVTYDESEKLLEVANVIIYNDYGGILKLSCDVHYRINNKIKNLSSVQQTSEFLRNMIRSHISKELKEIPFQKLFTYNETSTNLLNRSCWNEVKRSVKYHVNEKVQKYGIVVIDIESHHVECIEKDKDENESATKMLTEVYHSIFDKNSEIANISLNGKENGNFDFINLIKSMNTPKVQEIVEENDDNNSSTLVDNLGKDLKEVKEIGKNDNVHNDRYSLSSDDEENCEEKELIKESEESNSILNENNVEISIDEKLTSEIIEDNVFPESDVEDKLLIDGIANENQIEKKLLMEKNLIQMDNNNMNMNNNSNKPSYGVMKKRLKAFLRVHIGDVLLNILNQSFGKIPSKNLIFANERTDQCIIYLYRRDDKKYKKIEKSVPTTEDTAEMANILAELIQKNLRGQHDTTYAVCGSERLHADILLGKTSMVQQAKQNNIMVQKFQIDRHGDCSPVNFGFFDWFDAENLMFILLIELYEQHHLYVSDQYWYNQYENIMRNDGKFDKDQMYDRKLFRSPYRSNPIYTKKFWNNPTGRMNMARRKILFWRDFRKLFRYGI
ncbi:hypothetical protein SNEBB_009052 [Seison nebaliae]|nr:hypothetical protein SNEBB_009052 [Seison nebaliae]